jgi:gluconolactonase
MILCDGKWTDVIADDVRCRSGWEVETVAETWDWELLAGPATITEGPAWDGSGLFYTSIDDNEIRRYDPSTGDIVTVYHDTGASNGLAFGPEGALYACEGKGRRVVRYGPEGVKTTLVDRFEGRRLNSPNDLVLDRAGRIWFTDPRYGEDHSDRELDHDSVYRITSPGGGEETWEIERLTFDTTRPNGLLLSWDERTLFLAQSDYAAGSVRQLRAYPIQSDGTLGDFTLLHDFGEARGIDGMCWDADGNIVATCGWERSGPGPRIAVFATDGTVLEQHLLPTTGGPTNCIFGGTSLDTLYVTTLDGRLYRVPNTGRRGYLEPPSVRPYIPRPS